MANYSGTMLTGTSNIAKTFPNIGINKWFYVDDTYKNTSTGHVYRCSSAGYATATSKYAAAKWTYHHTDVAKKPTTKVASLTSPERGRSNLVFTSSWKTPDAMTSSKSGSRATGLKITKTIGYRIGKKSKKVVLTGSAALNTTSASLNIASSSVKVGKKSGRQAFAPYTTAIVESVSISVQAVNGKGTGPAQAATRKIAAPGKPKLAMPTVNTETGVVSCVITPYPDTGYGERVRTRYRMWKKDVGSAGNGKWTKTESTSTSDDPITITSGDLTSWQNSAHHWVIAFQARSEGMGGNSAWTDWKYCGVGFPKAACTLGKAVLKGKTATDSGYLEIKKTNSSTEWPVDRVVLQKLQSTSAADSAAAQAAQGWEDTQSSDNSKCKALSFIVGDVAPTDGTHTWLRVKSWNDLENVFVKYSDAVELKSLYQAAPSAADNECTIVAATPLEDGESVQVIIGWDKKTSSADDDTTSMQLAWSDDSGAWESTEPPEPFEFDWKDSTTASAASASWNKSATVKVKGLEEGVPYAFRSRCVTDAEGLRTFGSWCKTVTAIPSVAPTNAVLAAPATVPHGQGIPFSWSFAGGGTQKSWQLMSGTTVLLNGEGQVQSCTLDAERAEEYAQSGALSAKVRVSTGGGSVDSPTVEVLIADAPVLSIGEMSDLDAQPLEIPLTCSIGACSVAIIVAAQGCSDEMLGIQAEGDTVWSASVLPAWEYDSEDGAYAATIELPDGRDFRDGALYSIEAVATDPATGLKSVAASAVFGVVWSHQAPLPPDAVELAPTAAVDTDGKMRRYVAITLAAPQDAAEGDVYDVYRVTGDGRQLIAEGLALDGTVTDYCAPFGNATHYYRIVCRTGDGDIAWRDFDYQLGGVGLRFDFDGEEHDYVELRWNLQQQDAYAKDFMLSKAMDGTRSGAWGSAIERRGHYQTDVIKLTEQSQIDAIRDLARTADAVFVRTSMGLAFAANVDVDAMECDEKSPGMAVSFTATEIDQDERFMAALPETGETGETS